jgi:2'-5' RNA ligase
MSDPKFKRLFFGLEILSAWPEVLPEGRIISEQNRHMTLAFLGSSDFEKLKSHLHDMPLPDFKVGIVGQFDQPLFLPPHHPHVVAWGISWLEESQELLSFYDALAAWLDKIECPCDRRHGFLPHVTIARPPFHIHDWKKSFSPLPMMTGSFHLYESLGNLEFSKLWTHPLLPPFEEIEHTADIAYLVHAKDFNALFNHAKVALSFSFPPLLPFLTPVKSFNSVEEIVMELNEIVRVADREVGCPFKAVSFHGKLVQDELYHWEMIIDV